MKQIEETHLVHITEDMQGCTVTTAQRPMCPAGKQRFEWIHEPARSPSRVGKQQNMSRLAHAKQIEYLLENFPVKRYAALF